MPRNRTTVAAASVIFAMSCVPRADATIIYDTAGTYLINTTVNDNVITDDAGVNVVVGSGGVLRGVEFPSPGAFPGAIRTRSGNLEVTGNGRIIAAPNQSAISQTGGYSSVRLRDHASVVGDISSASPGLRDESNAFSRLYIQDHAVVNGSIRYGNFVRIQDQALILGDVAGYGNTNVTLDMQGGTVVGALRLGGSDDHLVTMSGGSFLGGFRGNPSYVELTMTGGYFGDGFRTIGNLQGSFRGGQIDGGISIDQYGSYSALGITGGIFDTYGGEWLLAFSNTSTSNWGGTSNLDIAGGQFGYAEGGNGFFLDEWVNFSIYGSDLVYSDGWLRGYLQDGSWFSNQLTFGDNWHGAFTIHNVPEPATWGMLLAGLIGMGFARRRPGGESLLRSA